MMLQQDGVNPWSIVWEGEEEHRGRRADMLAGGKHRYTVGRKPGCPKQCPLGVHTANSGNPVSLQTNPN